LEYDRLSTLFGKDRTDRIYKVLENERTMAETENKALAGSKTAAITAAQKEVELSPGGPGVFQTALDMKTGSALKRLKDLAWSGVAQRQQSNLNDNIADIIMGSGPLKADTVGKSAMVPAMLEAIMRPDVNPRPTARSCGATRATRYTDKEAVQRPLRPARRLV